MGCAYLDISTWIYLPGDTMSPCRVEVLQGRSRSPGAVPSAGSARGETAANCSLTDCGYFMPTNYLASKIYVWIAFM